MLLNHWATALGSSGFTSFGQRLRRGHYWPASICVRCSNGLVTQTWSTRRYLKPWRSQQVPEEVNEILAWACWAIILGAPSLRTVLVQPFSKSQASSEPL